MTIETLTSEFELLQQRYKLQRQLGSNAGRRTWLAQDLQTDEAVVIKLLLFDSSLAWDDLRLFEREAETLKALSHPAIPRYLDFLELELSGCKGLALVQSYVEGRSLQDYLQSGRSFSEAEIKQLVRSLLQILTYLHDRHPAVIHRDIKPSNILLTHRSGHSIGEVYLVDFGSVQTLATQAGRTVTVVGTYGYMPPEQFGGRASPASDLYGVGATAIALATGKHPAELPQKDLRLQFEGAARLSPSFEQWLRQMTEPSLERRFGSAEAALRSLAAPVGQSWDSISTPGRRMLSTLELVCECVVHTSGFGLLAGALSGGFFGTAIFPIVGTSVGSVLGGIAGGILGALDGALLAAITQIYFAPLRNVRRHRRVMQLVSGGFVAVTAVTVVLVFSPAIGAQECPADPNCARDASFGSRWGLILAPPAAVLSGLSASLAGRKVAEWYEQETRADEELSRY